MAIRPTFLCILDGLGLNPQEKGNAVLAAHTPCLDGLLENCPSSTLTTFGEAVGLPEGQMGNSEVGHLNIGAGRVVEQWLVRIKNGLKSGSAFTSPVYQNFFDTVKESRAIHLFGLCSDGGVHSHIEHLKLLLPRLRADVDGELLLHLITDGRDTAPTSAQGYLEAVKEVVDTIAGCRIASICGRFYAMDRDKRWERTERAFQAYVHGKGNDVPSFSAYLKESYDSGVTDEFIEPAVRNYKGIQRGDGVIFWNFRADRMRQLVATLCTKDFSGFTRNFVPFDAAHTLLFTEYDQSFQLPSLFETVEITNYLGAAIARHNVKQLRAAETEKYPHVTYFLNGGEEAELTGEERIMVPSPRDVKTYDMKPEMSAPELTAAVLARLEERDISFLALNFANADMVGHTGDFEAAKRAVETVDKCLAQVLKEAESLGAAVVVIADHGNAEQMICYDTGAPHTAHTTYPVPVAIFNAPEVKGVRPGGALCDVAPTVLELMGIPKPPEMTGQSLIQR